MHMNHPWVHLGAGSQHYQGQQRLQGRSPPQTCLIIIAGTEQVDYEVILTKLTSVEDLGDSVVWLRYTVKPNGVVHQNDAARSNSQG